MGDTIEQEGYAETTTSNGSTGGTTAYGTTKDAHYDRYSTEREVWKFSAALDASASATCEQSVHVGPSYSLDISLAKIGASAGLSDTNVYGALSDIILSRGTSRWQKGRTVTKCLNETYKAGTFKTTASLGISHWDYQLGHKISLRSEAYKESVPMGEFGGDDCVMGGSYMAVSTAKADNSSKMSLLMMTDAALIANLLRTLVQTVPLKRGIFKKRGTESAGGSLCVSAFATTCAVVPLLLSVTTCEKRFQPKVDSQYSGPGGYGAPNRRGIRIDVAGSVGNGFWAKSAVGEVELKNKTASIKLTPDGRIDIDTIGDCLFSVGDNSKIELERGGRSSVKAGNSEMSLDDSIITLKQGQSEIKMTSAAAQLNGSQVAGGVVSNCSFTFTNGTAMI